MKTFRLITFFLILSVAFAPAISAACSITCSSGELSGGIVDAEALAESSHSSVAADHCHHDSSSHHEPSHKNCNMAGCHFVQSVALNETSGNPFHHAADAVRWHFDTFAVSADLSPPIKPPA